MARIAFLAVFCIIIATASAAEAAAMKTTITCGVVMNSMKPCFPYIWRNVSTPPPGCCIGLTSISRAATTTPDRQMTCTCLKIIVGKVPSRPFFIPYANYAAANELIIKRCGITDLPYKLGPTTDCSRVK